MPALPKLSFTNLVAASGVVITPSTEATDYDADNLKQAKNPHLPWRTTTVASDQNAVVDFLTAKVLAIVALIHANFTSATIQGNATDSWGSPSYSQAVTIGKCRWNRRYQHAHLPSGFNFRYLRLLIPTQTPIDGASYFSLGGLWAGATSDFLRAPVLPVEIETHEPDEDVLEDHGAAGQRVSFGDPVAKLRLVVRGQQSVTTPGAGDQLASWWDLEESMRSAGVFLYYEGLGTLSNVIVCRRGIGTVWTLERGRATRKQLELVEAVGP